MTTTAEFGAVAALWRYPVKSMMGEELVESAVSERGLLGDRAYAIVDADSGKVASAKNPKRWPNLFDCHAAFLAPPSVNAALPPVRVRLPDGSVASSAEADFDELMSGILGGKGQLHSSPPSAAVLEEYVLDEDRVQDDPLPVGTFFDCATVHLLTTATIDSLRAAYPAGRFEPRRFRPNIIVGSPADSPAFPELDWVGHDIRIGDEVMLRVTGQAPRCVMTTLPQGDLPKDPGILRTAARSNGAHVGAYAEVLHGGIIRRGDTVSVQSA